MRLQWTAADVDKQLLEIMKNIHDRCVLYGQKPDYIDYVQGANLAAFTKVADTMLAYGVI